ncbi:MAG: hypothetical protein KI791_21625 [Cyclobacteriaceae bacterium]|nr:hypothetical protein [Cyclobacteriaceae bacterium SS2]
MKKHLGYIILSLILTLAVTDYIWVELLSHDDQVSIELETESKEAVGESESSETRHDTFDDYWSPTFNDSSYQTLFSGVFRFGNTYRPLAEDNNPKFIIRYCQLRLPC